VDINEVKFVTAVSTATKIDPRVLIAWIQIEGAYAPHGTGHFNYLNMRPYPGDRYSSVSAGDFEQFSNVNDAIYSTVRRLNQPFARPILSTAASKPTPRQQIAAIAATGWDAGHYGGSGGVSLVNTYSSLFKNPDDSYLDPTNARAVSNTVGTGSAADTGSVDAGGAASAAGSAAEHIPGVKQAEGVVSAIGSVGDAVKWIGDNWDRVLEVIAGFILAILGASFVYKKQTGSYPVPIPGRG